jgi:hypothetical protein
MQAIIDRFEGSLAVCEKPDRTMIQIPRSRLPSGAKEGDVIIIEGEIIRIDAAETAQRKIIAEESLKKLFKNS